MPRNSNWFTGVRNHGRREGHSHRIPVCSRHGQIRHEEEAGTSSSTTEDERRELERRRERRREIRQRLRGEENLRSERPKKRSTRSRICAWLNCFVGIFIVIGLIFVFYVITTLIIDGSSPLDFISYSDNNQSTIENVTNTNKIIPSSNERNNTDDHIQSSTKKTEYKDKENNAGVSSTTNSHKAGSTEITERSSHMNDHNIDANDEKYFRPGLEAEVTEREVKYIKGPDGRSYIAFVPVQLDNEEKDSKNNEYIDKAKTQVRIYTASKSGKSPYLYRYDDDNKYSDRDANHRIVRPIDKNNNFRPSDPDNLDSKIISHYVPPPDNWKIQRVVKISPASINRHVYQDSSQRPYDTNVRRIGNNRDVDQDIRYNVREHRPYGTSVSETPRRSSTREKFGEDSSQSIGVPVNSRPNSHARPPKGPRIRNSHRDRYTESKHDNPHNSYRLNERRQRPLRNNYRRPPSEFRYPPTAGSIQDIIEYMNRDRDINKKYEPNYESGSHRNNNKPLNKPNVFYIEDHGDQSYDKGENNEDRPVYYIKEDGSILESYSDESLGSSRYDINNNYNEHSDDPNASYDYDKSSKPPAKDRPLPPVKNTYDVYGSAGSRPREKTPLKLILDIYPAEDLSSGSASNILQSSVSIEGDYRRNGNNEGYNTEDIHKKQIVLHLNLYPQQPTHRAEPSSREDRVSMEIPLTGGLSPFDIYKAFVAQARKSPVASPRRGHLTESSSQLEEKIKVGGINSEDGRRLLGAIEDGLRQLDYFLPDGNKFNFSEVPINEDDLFGTETRLESGSTLIQNHRVKR